MHRFSIHLGLNDRKNENEYTYIVINYIIVVGVCWLLLQLFNAASTPLIQLKTLLEFIFNSIISFNIWKTRILHLSLLFTNVRYVL